MSKSSSEMVILVIREDLSFVLQPSEGAAVYHSIAISLETGAVGMLSLRMFSPTRLPGPDRVSGKRTALVAVIIASGR